VLNNCLKYTCSCVKLLMPHENQYINCNNLKFAILRTKLRDLISEMFDANWVFFMHVDSLIFISLLLLGLISCE